MTGLPKVLAKLGNFLKKIPLLLMSVQLTAGLADVPLHRVAIRREMKTAARAFLAAVTSDTC